MPIKELISYWPLEEQSLQIEKKELDVKSQCGLAGCPKSTVLVMFTVMLAKLSDEARYESVKQIRQLFTLSRPSTISKM